MLLNPHLDQLQLKLRILLLKQTGMLNKVAVLAMVSDVGPDTMHLPTLVVVMVNR